MSRFLSTPEVAERHGAGCALPRLGRPAQGYAGVLLANLGDTLIPGSPACFGKLIADETEKWAKIIRTANIKL